MITGLTMLGETLGLGSVIGDGALPGGITRITSPAGTYSISSPGRNPVLVPQ